jgi:hypothetical protein
MEIDKEIYDEMHVGIPLMITIVIGLIISGLCVIWFIVALVNAIYNLIIRII